MRAARSRTEYMAPQRAGFTLVEMLVVVALVTILVGVLAPVAVQSRNRARAAACVSNLRQLAAAVSVYGQDWSDALPRLSGSPFAGSAQSANWADGSSATELRAVLLSYTKNTGIFRCANDNGAPEFGFPTSDGPVSARCGSSYLPWSSARPGRYGISINGSRSRSGQQAAGDCILRDYGSSWHGFRTRSGLDLEVTAVANAAFADGHVTSVPIFAAAVSGRDYSCYASPKGGKVVISGGSGDVRVQLSGKCVPSTDSSGRQPLKLLLSGTVEGGGTVYDVDRVFSFAGGTRLDSAFRQVAVWADGLIAR